MKSFVFYFLAAFGLATGAYALTVGGNINNGTTYRDAVGNVVLPVIQVGLDGTPTVVPTPVQGFDGSVSITVQGQPIENITALSTYSLVSYTVTTVNLTTTVGTTCGLGTSVWICSPSAGIFFQYGNLTFTPGLGQMIAGYAGQLAANALDVALPSPVKDGGKLYLTGNGGTAIVTIKTGCYLAR